MNNEYSFCKFRIPEQGRRVIWEITNECNYGCKYCIFASTGRKPEGELDTSQVFKVLRELRDNGFTYVKYTGGEPFIREDMMDILRETKALGFDCDISTNASKITPQMAHELALLDLEMIHVSLDGHTQQIHEAVRGKKSFFPTIEGLKNLTQANNKIRIGCVIHEHNQKYLKEMIEYCEGLGINELIFSMMEPVGRLKDKNIGLSNKSSSDLKNDILSHPHTIKVSHNLEPMLATLKPLSQLKSKSCPGGDKFLFINSLGMVSPCPWVADKRPDLIAENINKNSLHEIMQSMNKFQDITKTMPGVCPVEDMNKFNKIEKFYGKFYAFTTENLDYMNSLEFKNKTVMTVGGSFDQAIVAYMLGAIKVTNIDINPIAKYWAELKYICLKNMDFNTYKNFLLRNKDALTYEVFSKIKKLLSTETLQFFEEQYSLFPDLRESLLFNNKYDSSESKINLSIYLKSEENYKIAQESLKEFIWMTQDIANITSEFFDIILLSNISDYSHILYSDDHVATYRDNIVLPWFSKLKPKGFIMLGYVYDYYNILESQKRNLFNLKEKRLETYKNSGIYKEIIVETALTTKTLHDCACILETNE
jgi:MoaA/NifB/PqqE/SkfB family radical SAM enzyme